MSTQIQWNYINIVRVLLNSCWNSMIHLLHSFFYLLIKHAPVCVWSYVHVYEHVPRPNTTHRPVRRGSRGPDGQGRRGDPICWGAAQVHPPLGHMEHYSDGDPSLIHHVLFPWSEGLPMLKRNNVNIRATWYSLQFAVLAGSRPDLVCERYQLLSATERLVATLMSS